MNINELLKMNIINQEIFDKINNFEENNISDFKLLERKNIGY